MVRRTCASHNVKVDCFFNASKRALQRPPECGDFTFAAMEVVQIGLIPHNACWILMIESHSGSRDGRFDCNLQG